MGEKTVNVQYSEGGKTYDTTFSLFVNEREYNTLTLLNTLNWSGSWDLQDPGYYVDVSVPGPRAYESICATPDGRYLIGLEPTDEVYVTQYYQNLAVYDTQTGNKNFILNPKQHYPQHEGLYCNLKNLRRISSDYALLWAYPEGISSASQSLVFSYFTLINLNTLSIAHEDRMPYLYSQGGINVAQRMNSAQYGAQGIADVKIAKPNGHGFPTFDVVTVPIAGTISRATCSVPRTSEGGNTYWLVIEMYDDNKTLLFDIQHGKLGIGEINNDALEVIYSLDLPIETGTASAAQQYVRYVAYNNFFICWNTHETDVYIYDIAQMPFTFYKSVTTGTGVSYCAIDEQGRKMLYRDGLFNHHIVNLSTLRDTVLTLNGITHQSLGESRFLTSDLVLGYDYSRLLQLN